MVLSTGHAPRMGGYRFVMPAGPPKCGCGLYAVGECVACDTPLCAEHGTMDEKFRCAKHHNELLAAREAEAEAKKWRERDERMAAAQAARDERDRVDRERREREATAGAEAARRERATAAQRAEQERQRQIAWEAEEAERARRRVAAAIASYPCGDDLAKKLMRAGVSADAAHRWVRAGVPADDILDWIADGCDSPELVKTFRDSTSAGGFTPTSVVCKACGSAVSVQSTCACT